MPFRTQPHFMVALDLMGPRLRNKMAWLIHLARFSVLSRRNVVLPREGGSGYPVTPAVQSRSAVCTSTGAILPKPKKMPADAWRSMILALGARAHTFLFRISGLSVRPDIRD
ncbi:hypothetical protein NFI96_020877 [Prochilodus magdalenae]|nr:hypothetical protein NFI96_020877 [Prochilodus magdalenae]